MLEVNKIICGEAIEEMVKLPDGSIDCVITDPPYGTTACKWDTCIPFEPMWEQLKRVTKKNGAIVLFGSQPFTSALVMSNPKMFKYEWVWDKVKPAGHLNSKKRPMNRHEDILVFCKGVETYNPQNLIKGVYNNSRPAKNQRKQDTTYGTEKVFGLSEYKNYPQDIIIFPKPIDTTRTHPTQKPVALFEYLIKTYTNEGETVLDFCGGSGTTGVAAKNLKRNYILIEKEPEYCKIAEVRINAIKQETLL